jgi:hypothetical protein
MTIEDGSTPHLHKPLHSKQCDEHDGGEGEHHGPDKARGFRGPGEGGLGLYVSSSTAATTTPSGRISLYPAQ